MTQNEQGCCGAGSCGKSDPRTMVTVVSVLVAVASLVYAFGFSEPAYRPKPEAGKVVAKLNGKEITEGDILSMVRDQVPDVKLEQIQKSIPQLTDQYINMQLLDAAAKKSGVAKLDETRKQMELARSQVLRAVYLKNETEGKVTDAAIDASYKEQFPDGKLAEIKARHILVKTKAEADAVLEQLKKGESFETLAKAKSIDTGSAKQGGDLGFFPVNAMVKPFADAVSAMKDGELSKEPVQSQFGWHIIKREESKTRPAPSKQEVTGALRQQLVQKEVDALVKSLRDAAKIEPMAAEPAAPEAPKADAVAPAPAPVKEEMPAPEKK